MSYDRSSMTAFGNKQSLQEDKEQPQAAILPPDSGSLRGARFFAEPRKPHACQQLSFEFTDDSSEIPALPDLEPFNSVGDRHALQDDCPRTPKAAPEDAQSAPQETTAPSGAGSLCESTQGQSRSVDRPPV